MWDNLPSDVLANVFSYLPPCSLAHAVAACHHWHDSGREMRQNRHHHLPWLIALPARSTSRHLCFRPLSTIGGQGLVVFKSTGGGPIRLSVCNPFTGQFGHLPHLQKPRTNPAVGVIEGCTNQFKLYVARGMSEAASGDAASYKPTLEMFDIKRNKWTVMGSMPVEFAVRLTVWTPNECLFKWGPILDYLSLCI
ncbi:F-box domain, cyclin-like protein [Artemisia annua]|uniref:F-box domain, cyclin-like protein n=1 Tax=Artemisia annua TaxID=35608 RepID=A0A2U1MRS3_ARTAN|nr:F-box domain, cyclin-like protein [Artemisia annua]